MLNYGGHFNNLFILKKLKMNYIKKLNTSLLIGLLFLNFSCTKEEGPLSDIIPSTPIIVSNAIAFRPEPTVGVSKSAVVSPGVVGPIQIVLSIPASSPRTFKSITKVATPGVASYSRIQGTTGLFYITSPIPASGKSATFITSLTEYLAKTPAESPAPAGSIAATNTELARRFYFLVTLDDGTEIVTEPVRVLVFD
jgi:hypothetical protein